MGDLSLKIQDDLRAAFKRGEQAKLGTLRLLQAAIKNAEIEKRKKLWESKDSQSPEQGEGRSGAEPTKEERLRTDAGLTDEETIEVVMREVKKRREAAELYRKGNREDLVLKEETEAAMLEAYMPRQVPEAELRGIIDEAVSASSDKNLGKIMAAVMAKVKGKADGTVVRKIVEEMLK